MGNQEFMGSFNELGNEYKPVIRLNVGTRRNKEESRCIIPLPGYSGGVVADSRGLAGGLWLLYDKESLQVDGGANKQLHD